jgi:hypothetical protein
LSDKKRGKSEGAGKGGSGKPPPHPKKRQRTTDVSRTLRLIYDDTVREPIPDDLRALISKLG